MKPGLLWLGLIQRPARRDPFRVLLSVAGVAIGVGAVASIHRANESIVESFRGAVESVSGRARLTVRGIGGVPEQTGARLRWVWEIGSFAPAIDRFAVTADGTDEPVEILGVDPTSEAPLRSYRILSPKIDIGKLFEKNAALAPLPFVTRHRARLGSPIPLFVNGRPKSLVLAGVLDLSGPARASGGQVLVTGLRTAQDLFEMPGRVDRIDIAFPDSLPFEPVRARVAASLSPGTRVERPEARSETADKMTRAFRFNLAALGSIALLVGMFLIYNTVSISVLRRRPEIGTLRALGASRAAVFRAFLAEGLAIGLAGTVAGEALGLALSRAALSSVGRTVVNIYQPTASLSLTGSLEPFVMAAVVGLLASLSASLAPAAEAARVAPATTMRPGSLEGSRRNRAPRFAAVAFALALAGLGVSFLPPVAGFPTFGFTAVAFAVAALAFAAPGAVLALERIGRRPLRRWLGAPGRLAGAFFSGNVSRNAVAIAALSLALGMTGAMAVMIASLRETVRTWVNQSIASDLFLKSATGSRRGIIGTIPGEALEFLRAIPGVALVDPFRGVDVVDEKGAPFTIGSGDFGVGTKTGGLPFFSRRNPAALLAAARARGEVFVSEPFARRFGKWPGDLVEIPTPAGPRTFPIADVYSDFSNDRGTVVMDRPLFLKLFHDASLTTIGVTAAPGVSPDVLRDRILAAASGKFSFTILTNRTLRTEVLRVFDATFAVTYGLEGIALLVAVLGVLNALFSLILERRRDLGLLRILGASRGQLRRSIAIEAGMIGACSLILAALAASAFAALLILVINRQSFGWTIRARIPWIQLAVAFALVQTATIAASLGPARLAEAVDPARAMREE
ncbi:MAG: FtsX-like permease family protein [Thermoanaerobaculia bacterium]